MARMQPHGRVHEFSNGAKAITLEPPPRGMQLVHATDEELAHYGLPPRPDRETEPSLYELWHRTFDRPLHFIVPEFEESSEEWHRACQPPSANEENAQYSPNWSGVVAGLEAHDPVSRAVAATWTVPNAVSVDGGDDRCAIWVGIDGYYYVDAQGNYYLPSQDPSAMGVASPLLQAGITCLGGSGSYAWWEWIAPGGGMNPPIRIMNVQPYAGQFFETQIWVTSETTANVYMFAGDPYTDEGSEAFLTPLMAPLLTSVWGSSAEWIVERLEKSDGSWYTLPDYGTVQFYGALGWTASGGTLNSGQGTALTIKDTNGATLSAGQMVPSGDPRGSEVQCTYGHG